MSFVVNKVNEKRYVLLDFEGVVTISELEESRGYLPVTGCQEMHSAQDFPVRRFPSRGSPIMDGQRAILVFYDYAASVGRREKCSQRLFPPLTEIGKFVLALLPSRNTLRAMVANNEARVETKMRASIFTGTTGQDGNIR